MSALRSFRRRLRLLWAARDAVVAVEFALALPLLLTLYLGTYVITDMILCSRKVTIATRELTDMSTRYVSLPNATIQNILGAAQQVLTPYNYTKATIWISEVKVVDATHVQIVWSKQLANGSTVQTSADAPHATGNTLTVQTGLIPANLIPVTNPASSSPGDYCTSNNPSSAIPTNGTPAGCLMLGEVAYSYTPVVGIGTWGTSQLYDSIYMQPRLSSGVPNS